MGAAAPKSQTRASAGNSANGTMGMVVLYRTGSEEAGEV
jgi:hypothetical protein